MILRTPWSDCLGLGSTIATKLGLKLLLLGLSAAAATLLAVRPVLAIAFAAYTTALRAVVGSVIIDVIVRPMVVELAGRFRGVL